MRSSVFMNVTMLKTRWTSWMVRWWTGVLCASKWPDIRVPTEILVASAVEAPEAAVETEIDLVLAHDLATAGEGRDRDRGIAGGDPKTGPGARGTSPSPRVPETGPGPRRMDPKAQNRDPKARRLGRSLGLNPRVPSTRRLDPPADLDPDPDLTPKAAVKKK